MVRGWFGALRALFRVELFLSLVLIQSTLVTAQLAPPTDTSSLPHYVGITTLVISRYDAKAALPRTFMDGVGANYVLSKTNDPSQGLVLEKTVNVLNATGHVVGYEQHGLYNSIIIASDEVDELNTDDGYAAVRRYARHYNVRIVFLKVTLDKTMSGVKEASVLRRRVFDEWGGRIYTGFDIDTLTKSPALSDVMNDYGYWRIFDHQQMSPGQFNVPANNKDVTVLMRYGQEGQGQVKPDGMVSVFLAKTSHGTEEMYFGWDAAHNIICSREQCKNNFLDKLNVGRGEDSVLNLALANMWFTWATRGIFLGQRKAYFQLHIDDWYSRTAIFPDYQLAVRLVASDVKQIVDWQNNLTAAHQLPEGSDFRFELAYNGAGFASYQNYDNKETAAAGTSLSKASMDHRREFNWVSHTWTHQHLDWATADNCNMQFSKCLLKKDRMLAELNYNVLLADGKPVKIDTRVFKPDIEYMENLNSTVVPFNWKLPANRFSRGGLVPPEISGLYPRTYVPPGDYVWPAFRAHPRPDNKELFEIFSRLGIRTVTGDNSRPELFSWVSPHHPVLTNLSEYSVDGIAIIPRHALNIAYNVHNEERFLQYYNMPGASQCHGTFGAPCDKKGPYTLDEAIDRQAYNALYYILAGRADPYMFHQANLHHFTKAGTKNTISLVTYFADAFFYRYMNLISKMPIQSPNMDAIGQHFRDRKARDDCGITALGKLVDGKIVHVQLNAANPECRNAKALITVRRSERLQLVGATVSNYGIDAVFKYPITKNGTTSELSVSRSSDSYTPQVVPKPPSGFTFTNEDGVTVVPSIDPGIPEETTSPIDTQTNPQGSGAVSTMNARVGGGVSWLVAGLVAAVAAYGSA